MYSGSPSLSSKLHHPRNFRFDYAEERRIVPEWLSRLVYTVNGVKVRSSPASYSLTNQRPPSFLSASRC